ncbi:MAG: CBS domain-containing protein [Acidimicrobiia bacterium]|nr:CBS domain-containing protein [Acidimicrobiia bacterium]
MKVKSILADKGSAVHRVGPARTLLAAAHDLKRLGVGALVVCGESGQVHGLLTERDIVYAVASHAGDVSEVKVSDAMTRRVVTCDPDDEVAEVMARMTVHRTRHVPVMRDGALVGIVSIGDVVKSRLESMQADSAVLRQAYLASR